MQVVLRVAASSAGGRGRSARPGSSRCSRSSRRSLFVPGSWSSLLRSRPTQTIHVTRSSTWPRLYRSCALRKRTTKKAPAVEGGRCKRCAIASSGGSSNGKSPGARRGRFRRRVVIVIRRRRAALRALVGQAYCGHRPLQSSSHQPSGMSGNSSSGPPVMMGSRSMTLSEDSTSGRRRPCPRARPSSRQAEAPLRSPVTEGELIETARAGNRPRPPPCR